MFRDYRAVFGPRSTVSVALGAALLPGSRRQRADGLPAQTDEQTGPDDRPVRPGAEHNSGGDVCA